MNQRTTDILAALIEEYIRSGHPIGSSFLAERLTESLSPATIRAILHDLEEEGLISQPFTSAGRIPTDSGYRYYVNHLPVRPLPSREAQGLQRELAAEEQSGHTQREAIPRVLSRFTRTLSITIDPQRGEVHDAGLVEVVEESDTLDTIREISQVREAVAEAFEDLFGATQHAPAVFIGDENPLISAELSSIIAQRVPSSQGDVLLIMVGPKRMAYQRNLSFVGSLAALLQEGGL